MSVPQERLEPVPRDVRVSVQRQRVKDVVVVYGADPDTDDLLLDLLKHGLRTDTLIVLLPADGRLESLDENEMRRYGWVRA